MAGGGGIGLTSGGGGGVESDEAVDAFAEETTSCKLSGAVLHTRNAV